MHHCLYAHQKQASLSGLTVLHRRCQVSYCFSGASLTGCWHTPAWVLPGNQSFVAARPHALLILVIPYFLGSLYSYCRRSGYRHGIGSWEVLAKKLRRPNNMRCRTFAAALFGWLCFIWFYPMLEIICSVLGRSTFFYYYPNAQGAGMIFSPAWSTASARDVRNQAVRLDWHLIHIQVPSGAGDYQSSSVTLNVPHLTVPAHGLKAWPWKQHLWLIHFFRWRWLSCWLRSRCSVSESLLQQLQASWRVPHLRTEQSASGGCMTAEVSSQVALPALPTMRLLHEKLICVQGRNGMKDLQVASDMAMQSLEARGGRLRVAVDAEWGQSEGLSLLQLAVDVQYSGAGGMQPPAQVFLVDLLCTPPTKTLAACQKLLLPRQSGCRDHVVLAFSPANDIRRLQAVGILPPTAEQTARRVLPPGWVDLQRCEWGLGPQPGLQLVVRQGLRLNLDKGLQKSNWDCRPLSTAQLEYAALDAACLLRLHDNLSAVRQL